MGFPGGTIGHGLHIAPRSNLHVVPLLNWLLLSPGLWLPQLPCMYPQLQSSSKCMHMWRRYIGHVYRDRELTVERKGVQFTIEAVAHLENITMPSFLSFFCHHWPCMPATKSRMHPKLTGLEYNGTHAQWFHNQFIKLLSCTIVSSPHACFQFVTPRLGMLFVNGYSELTFIQPSHNSLFSISQCRYIQLFGNFFYTEF